MSDRYIVQFGFCGMPFRAIVPLTKRAAEQMAAELRGRLGEHINIEIESAPESGGPASDYVIPAR